MWSELLAAFFTALARLIAGSVVARDEGRTEVQQQQTDEVVKAKDEQVKIAAEPAADRSALLERMRNGQL